MWAKFKLACLIVFVAVFVLAGTVPAGDKEAKPRARQAGLKFGILKPGALNAISDVAGVKVGHLTLIEGIEVRTGVTAILPHGGNLFLEKVPAAAHVANGFGKLAGYTQLRELGEIESPILLTNTLSVGAVLEGGVKYMLALPGNEKVRSVNIVVGECNDGYLSDIRGLHVRPRHAIKAIENAKSGAVSEGCVGAGTGTLCHGFKGGIGTSSRVLSKTRGGYTVGVLVQTNFGRDLHIEGVPVGRLLKNHALNAKPDEIAGGSRMIVVATDAPLDSRNLKRLAARAMLGFGKTGGVSSNGSGDYVIAFSTAKTLRIKHGSGFTGGKVLANNKMTPLFQAVIDATQEAIINSLFAARTTTGFKGHKARALPVERAMEVIRQWGR